MFFAQEKQASLNQSVPIVAIHCETSLWQYLFSSHEAIKYLRIWTVLQLLHKC